MTQLSFLKFNSVSVFFLVLFLISGFYIIPFTDFSVSFVTQIKRVSFLFFIVLLISRLNFMKTTKEFTTIILGLLFFYFLGQFIYRQEYQLEYIKRIFNIIFIASLGSFILQSKKSAYLLLLPKIFKPFYIFLFFLSFIFFTIFNKDFCDAFKLGFGNNRANFQIWMLQFIFLIYLVPSKKINEQLKSKLIWIKDFKEIFFSSPILVLLTFYGLRTSIVISFIAILWFSFKGGAVKAFKVTLVFIFIIVAANLLSPIKDRPLFRQIVISENDLRISASKNANLLSASKNANLLNEFNKIDSISEIDIFYQFIDILTSQRLQTIFAGIRTISYENFLFGQGFDNVKIKLTGFGTGGALEIHNVYLQILTELGFVGFILFMQLFFYPFYLVYIKKKKRNKIPTNEMTCCTLFMSIGLIHPQLLVFQLSTCLIFWVCYFEIIRRNS